jgi:UDPglucose--hexose-1-phosphate uridylyltransferase
VYRDHPLTGEPILFAPDRAARPRAFGEATAQRCPFCPGHEDDTPAEVARVGDPWRVRVFPNKFPPIAGAEVIVESPRHEDSFATVDHVEDIVRVYADRFRAHAGGGFVSIFKNEGDRAGASIPHLHSQVVPLPFVPPRVQRELAGFADRCPLCALDGHVIAENESFRWLAPTGSVFAYQQWIIPRHHAQDIGSLGDLETRDLAAMLRGAAAATNAIARAFNWMFQMFPAGSRGHWYVDVVPRMTAIAGFELNTGTFVEIIDPAYAARRLQEKP